MRVEESPNYVRLVEAYEGLTRETLPPEQCLDRLNEVLDMTSHGLRGYRVLSRRKVATLTASQRATLAATREHTERLYQCAEAMVTAFDEGDLDELRAQYRAALECFQRLPQATQSNAVYK